MPDALLVTSSFLPGHGGIESYLAELCTLLRPRLAVMAPAVRDGKPLPRELGYEAIPGPGGMLLPRPPTAQAIAENAARLGTDRILFGTPWPLALLGPRLKRRGLRYAVIVHGAELLVPGALPLVSAKLADALAGAELLLPISDYTASRVRLLLERKGHDVPRIERLRARVDMDRFRPDVDTSAARRRLEIAPERRVVLCFGRLVARKGVDRLIRVMPEIADRVPEALLVVAGSGPQERRLRRLALRTRTPVVFTGRVAHEDAPGVYAMADVFALPVADRWFGLDLEGLGVVLLEAAASGVACVTGRSGGTPEAVIDGETGFVVDAHDGEELAGAIVRLLEDRQTARKMGEAGRAHVEAEFSASLPPKPLLDWLA
jgi:phosphatidylinositol alpha-1,6-mannosyltransferase